MSDLARSFGAQADAYDRGRPGWPVEAVDAVGLPREATVVDLAAGTGKLTRVLAERFDRVLAVEPDAGMRALNPGSLAGSAEAIPLEDASADGVFVAEAFHWFDAPTALAEIARVLRPGGALALLWNIPLNDLVDDHVWDSPGNSPKHNRFESGEWRGDFAGTAFGPLHEASVEHEQVLTADELADFYASISWVAVLPDAERPARIERFRSHLDRDRYERRIRTEVYWTERL